MSVLYLIAGVREAANALRSAEADAAEIADACGYVREIEVMLAEWRRTQEARLRDATDPIHDDMPTAPTDNPIDSPTVAGTRYELVPTYTTDRTYNTPRLLVDLAAAVGKLAGTEPSIGHLIAQLEDRDILELRWKYTNLKAYAKALGMTVATGHDSLTDPDLESPHIGEVKRQTGYKRKPVGP